MTLWDIMETAAPRAHKAIDASLTTDDDYLDVSRWVKQAVRYLQAVNDWECHKAEWELKSSTTPALTAGTYTYNLRTLKSDFRKLQGDAIYCGSSALTFYAEIAEIDRRLGGPQWKRSAANNSTPYMASLLGQSLVLAPKMSQDWITAHSDGIYGYYWRAEALTDVTATLLFYDDFFADLVDITLIYGLQQEDDAEFRTLLNLLESKRLPLLRGYDPAPRSDDQVDSPADVLGIEVGD